MNFEIIFSLILIFLLVIFFEPFGYMPPDFVMVFVILLIIVFSIFSLLIWKEKVKDEREYAIRNFSQRIAFLSTSVVLLLGIIVGSVQGRIDHWLVCALVVMVLGKMIGLWYAQKKH